MLYKFNSEGFEKRYIKKEDGCWEWIGAKNKEGRGTFTYGCTSRLAHRLSYAYYKGDIPELAYIQQTCNNRLCVNPDHLILEERKRRKINMEDYSIKKLTQKQIDVMLNALREAQKKL